MKYFEYIAILVFLAASFLTVYYFWRKLRLHHFYRLSFKAILKKQHKNCDENYLSTYYLFEIIKGLAQGGKSAKTALIYLCAGRIGQAQNYFRKRGYLFYAIILKAFYNPSEAITELEVLIRDVEDKNPALAELAVLYFIKGDKNKCRLCLDNINDKKSTTYVKARQAYFETYYHMEKGDLLSASQNCSAAIRNFGKCRAVYEEGQAYLLMGIIYRTAVISDVAELMFRSALNIFENLHAEAEIARVFGNFGMLMATQSRFEEAEGYYRQAEEINIKLCRIQAEAEINNQQGLMSLMKKNLDAAAEFSNAALKKHQKSANRKGIAFSKEILGNIAWEQKDYQQALQYAYEAKNIYRECNNMSAYLENMYLMALSFFEQGKLKEAEKSLREITKIARECSTNFHAANAYNLLGLIYLKQNDLRRAKGLFQQSLDLEQISNRLGGIATDYANISLIELQSGNQEQACKTLQTAIEYAQATADDELVGILKHRLEKLKT